MVFPKYQILSVPRNVLVIWLAIKTITIKYPKVSYTNPKQRCDEIKIWFLIEPIFIQRWFKLWLLVMAINDAKRVKLSIDNMWARDKTEVEITIATYPPSFIWFAWTCFTHHFRGYAIYDFIWGVIVTNGVYIMYIVNQWIYHNICATWGSLHQNLDFSFGIECYVLTIPLNIPQSLLVDC